MNQSLDNDPWKWESLARTDFRAWLMLVAGLGFAYACLTIPPSSTCTQYGDCWIQPVGAVVTLLIASGGLNAVITNPSRGFMVDPANGELVWWQNRTRTRPGLGGRIAPEDISRVQVIDDSDINTKLTVYDRAGTRLKHLDDGVIGESPFVWARKLVARWPHIELEEKH